MEKKAFYTKIVEWFDVRIGLTKTPLRPAPEFTLINPNFWLGALMAVAFVMQGITGLFQLIYYQPLTDQAYSSTMYVVNSVPLGKLIETMHLYTAYAMIALAFTHLMRNYFASVHKRPRELMWVAGVLLGLVVLSFGLTGYLLPWTVVSKSATDVAIGILSVLPGQLGIIVKFLVAGLGSDAEELRRFFTVHTVLLPAALLSLLALKLYMFEVHGACYVPAYVKDHLKSVPWFPKVFLYLAMIGSLFVACLLAVSATFPISLPPQFTPTAAANYVTRPDWYFLWLYQILKFAVFEGPNVVYALGVIVASLLLLILLPFYDRGSERKPSSRPVYVTVGAIIIGELVVLTVQGYVTPGQVITNSQAIITTGGTALIISILSWCIYEARSRILRQTAT